MKFKESYIKLKNVRKTISNSEGIIICRYLWSALKPYKWWCLLMLQAPLLSALYIFANNFSLKLLVDAFSGETQIQYASLFLPIFLFTLAQIGPDLSWRLSNFAEWKAEPLARRIFLLKAYNYIQYHSYSFFQNTPSGVIVSKIKGILEGYDYILNLHHTIIRTFFISIFSVIFIAFFNVYIFYFIAAWCILIILIMYPQSLELNQASREAAESTHRVLGTIADNITNIFSLFYFSKRKIEFNRIDSIMSNDCIPQQIVREKCDFKFCVIGGLLYWIMLFSVLLFMVYLRKNTAISTGDFLFVMLTTITIISNLGELISGIGGFLNKMGDLKASFSILSMPHEAIDNPSAKDLRVFKGGIEFKNIFFSYDDKSLLFSGLNLSISPGEKVGIVGHSGVGKSTLISLLLKNFLLTSGEIFIDNQALSKITSDSLRQQISLIPQDVMLFHRSIAENIGYAKENASLQEIKEAAKMANIHDFIESLPEKYNTFVGERGIKVSGGQRQRIAIARAILKNAPIIILDEATSSLDTITEKEIQKSIHQMLEKRKATVIAIAHRLCTIRYMDRIVVMDDGKILEQGSFSELIEKKNSYFKKLWDNQVNEMIV